MKDNSAAAAAVGSSEHSGRRAGEGTFLRGREEEGTFFEVKIVLYGFLDNMGTSSPLFPRLTYALYRVC